MRPDIDDSVTLDGDVAGESGLPHAVVNGAAADQDVIVDLLLGGRRCGQEPNDDKCVPQDIHCRPPL